MSKELAIQNLAPGTGESPLRENTGLEGLPVELILMILRQLPDLTMLDSVLRASPSMNRAFDLYAAEVAQAILLSGATCGHTCVIINIVALIRSSALPELRNFHQQVTAEAMWRYTRVRKSRDGFAPKYLASNTKPAVIRSILATNRRLTWLSIECLEFYLARFRSRKPRYPVAPDKNKRVKTFRTSEPSWRDDYVEACNTKLEDTECDSRDVGPPSWTEKQRVLRAFWRFRLIHDLKAAAENGRLSWPKERIDSQRTIIDDCYGQETVMRSADDSENPHHPEYEELKSVSAYTQQKFGSDINLTDAYFCLPQVPGEHQNYSMSPPGE